jgi:hypothetical protein
VSLDNEDYFFIKHVVRVITTILRTMSTINGLAKIATDIKTMCKELNLKDDLSENT